MSSSLVNLFPFPGSRVSPAQWVEAVTLIREMPFGFYARDGKPQSCLAQAHALAEHVLHAVSQAHCTCNDEYYNYVLRRVTA